VPNAATARPFEFDFELLKFPWEKCAFRHNPPRPLLVAHPLSRPVCPLRECFVSWRALPSYEPALGYTPSPRRKEPVVTEEPVWLIWKLEARIMQRRVSALLQTTECSNFRRSPACDTAEKRCPLIL
jgi:hypothetical protein